MDHGDRRGGHQEVHHGLSHRCGNGGGNEYRLFHDFPHRALLAFKLGLGQIGNAQEQQRQRGNKRGAHQKQERPAELVDISRIPVYRHHVFAPDRKTRAGKSGKHAACQYQRNRDTTVALRYSVGGGKAVKLGEPSKKPEYQPA